LREAPCEEVIVGLDGGYVRSRHPRPERNFEVIAGKVLDDEGNATRFAFVRSGGSEALSSASLALRRSGANDSTLVTALTDGDAGLRAIHRQLVPQVSICGLVSHQHEVSESQAICQRHK
jgi:prephenate dehydratase